MSDRSDTNEAGSKKLKLRLKLDDLPAEITFSGDDNGIEIRNGNLNPEFIPMYLPEEKKPRKKPSWLEKKQRKWR